MDEELVLAMKEAMTAPWAWTHRASLTPSQVLSRLNDLGYVVVKAADADAATPGAGASDRAAPPGYRQTALADLMADFDTQVEAARDRPGSESLQQTG